MNKGEDALTALLSGIMMIIFTIVVVSLVVAYPILAIFPIGMLALAIWVLTL